MECRRPSTQRRRRLRHRWQSRHDKRARGQQQPLSDGGTRRGSEQIPGESAIRGERLRFGADHRPGSRFFQEHDPPKIRRDPSAGIDRFGLWLSDRRRADVSDGHYDKYPDLGITYAKLQNPAQRKFLGLNDDDRGVLVSTVVTAGPSADILRPGDVLLAIDGHPIASDSNVELEGERAEFQEVVERKFRGDSVKFDIWRDKKPMTVTIRLYTPWPYLILGHSYDVHPRYVLYGGLLFQPLNLDLLESYRPTDLRLRHFFEYFVQDQIYLRHPDVIVLTNILPDPINTYLTAYRGGIVDEVNGKKIHTLDELASAFAETPEHFVIRLIGDGPPLVLDRNKVESARERIKARYNVLKEQNLEEQPVTKTPEQANKT